MSPQVIVINTIGDVRRFLENFGPESDDYPFVLWDTLSEQPVDFATSSVQPNEPGYPPFAMLVLSNLEEELAVANLGVDPGWYDLVHNEHALRNAVRKAAQG